MGGREDNISRNRDDDRPWRIGETELDWRIDIDIGPFWIVLDRSLACPDDILAFGPARIGFRSFLADHVLTGAVGDDQTGIVENRDLALAFENRCVDLQRELLHEIKIII